MTKIGTVTFHRANNFGAVLQAYALKHYLLSLGHECDVLDYRCKEIESKYHKKINFSRPTKVIKQVIQGIVDKTRYRKFDEFRSKYIKPCVCHENISSNDYDLVIVGSDQVWNMNLTNNDTGYLLDFVRTNKVSYAASFGVSDITEQQKEVFKIYLQDFSYISVRESQGVELVKEMVDKQASIVVDPVYLLSVNEWKNIFSLKHFSDRYIFVYLFGYTLESCEFINILKKKTGMKVYVYDNNIRASISADRYYHILSPTEWLEMIYNSSYVVTNSFHCTAFAMIFRRPFFEMPEANATKTGSRIQNLLEISGLQDVVLSQNLEKVEEIDINWEGVEGKLERYIADSKQFINRVIEKTNMKRISV